MQILINEIVSSHELFRIGIFEGCSVYAITMAVGLAKHYVRDKLIKPPDTFRKPLTLFSLTIIVPQNKSSLSESGF